MKEDAKTKVPSVTREKLLDAAVFLMRRQGFSATAVDQICFEAGVTKGAFFHYFKSKEELGGAAVEKWCASRADVYGADLRDLTDDPLVQLDRLLDGLVESARNPPDGVMACLLGMVSQEVGSTHDRMREACGKALAGWTGLVAGLLAAAKQIHPVRVDFDPEEIAWMFNSLWQGSLLVGKTRQDPEVVAVSFRHARAYVESLFVPERPEAGAT